MKLEIELTPAQVRELAGLVAGILRDESLAAPELIAAGEAAELAGVSRKTIANWLASGRLTRDGVARRPLVSRAELADLLATPRPTGQRTVRSASRRAVAGVFSLESRRSRVAGTAQPKSTGGDL